MVEQSRYPDMDPALESELGDGPQQPENPLLFAHRLLRGRYPWAIGLALTLGLAGAAAGYFAMKPKYQSEGIIQVLPTTPSVLYGTEENEVPPNFDSWVGAQQVFVQGARVRDLAVQDPELTLIGWPSGVPGAIKLEKQLSVRRAKGEQVIRVRIEDEQPRLAQEAVNSILRSYKRLYIDESGRAKTQRQEILEQLQNTLQAELRTLRERISDLAEEFGADNLQRLHAAAVDEITQLDAKIREVDMAIAETEARRGQAELATAAADDESAAVPPMIDPEAQRAAIESALAAQDRDLALLMQQERSLQQDLSSMKASGYGENHRAVRDVRNRMNATRIEIEQRVALLEEQFGPQDPSASLAGGNASIDQLRTLRARYDRLRQDAVSQADFLATRRRVIDGLQSEVAEKQEQLSDARERLEAIRIESRQHNEVTGRVSIASWGDLPMRPSDDKRLPAAGAGFVGGAGFGVGLVALLGLLNPSCRYVDDLERPTRKTPLLGTLPDLDTDDPEQEEMAALSVHQIRNVLELQHTRAPGGRVFTITSATAGEGKTSLSLALGMSFAAAGQRTLIVDADLIGRGITKQLNLSEKGGIREFLDDAPVEETTHPTPVASLFAMPTGSVKQFEPKNMSRERAIRAIERLRQTYEVVIVDTGPIMGSLEGNLVCALSDATILVVSRGQRSKFVQASLARIANIGGRCAGTVFNRAADDDYHRSMSHASFHVASVRSSRQPMTTDGALVGTRALVQAVAGAPHDPEDSD